jgi:hypothetical protein
MLRKGVENGSLMSFLTLEKWLESFLTLTQGRRKGTIDLGKHWEVMEMQDKDF